MKSLLNFKRSKNESNLISATFNLLTQLGVKVTITAIKDTLLSNPNYPSLLSVSESLRKWKVDSEAYTLIPDKLQVLPVPFIAHLKTNSGFFVTIRSMETEYVTYLTDDQSEFKIRLDDFLDQWSGTVLLAEASNESGQLDYKRERKREQLAFLRLPLLLLLIIVIGAIAFNGPLAQLDRQQLWLYIGFWACVISGIMVTTLLMRYEYDNNDSYIKKICSISKKTNCNAVLKSNASKILGFSWSEIGFFYFTGAFIYLMLGNYSATGLYPLILLNLMALPYILFSISYQGLIVKQWCILCLIVQIILFVEFLISLLTNHINGNLFHIPSNIAYSQLLLAYFLPGSLWMIFKQYLYGSKEDKETKYSFRRFKNSAEIFNSLLVKQSLIKNSTEGLGLIWGNPNAENTLIKVCNPYCGPCAQSFPYLEELLNLNGDKWKVQLIFTASADKNDRRALPVAHFLEMKDRERDDDNAIGKALGNWYNAKNKNYEDYTLKYPVPVNFERHKNKLAAMNDWCKNENIQFTPTYYINGRRLPENYQVEDLKDIF